MHKSEESVPAPGQGSSQCTRPESGVRRAPAACLRSSVGAWVVGQELRDGGPDL